MRQLDSDQAGLIVDKSAKYQVSLDPWRKAARGGERKPYED
jgi:hypothetical protein